MSSGTLSPSAVERAAASWRSPGVRQPLRRRMTNVSIYAPLIGLPGILDPPGRKCTGRVGMLRGAGGASGGAVDAGVPGLEPPGRVVLVDPGVEHVEGVEAEPVRRRLQH